MVGIRFNGDGVFSSATGNFLCNRSCRIYQRRRHHHRAVARNKCSAFRSRAATARQRIWGVLQQSGPHVRLAMAMGALALLFGSGIPAQWPGCCRRESPLR